MPAFDVLALPSRREGFGYVLTEAMAHAVPVVTTATSSMPEIVRDGLDGILVPPAQPDRLAEALRTILTNPERAWQMGQQGRQRVADRFTIQRMLDELEALFERLAASTARPRSERIGR